MGSDPQHLGKISVTSGLGVGTGGGGEGEMVEIEELATGQPSQKATSTRK